MAEKQTSLEIVTSELGQNFFETLADCIVELRDAGLPISVSEQLDAYTASGHINLSNKFMFRETLAVTLVKKAEHLETFYTIFSLYFGTRLSVDTPMLEAVSFSSESTPEAAEEQSTSSREQTALSAEELAETLSESFFYTDRSQFQYLARQAVHLHAQIEKGRPVGSSYYLFKVTRSLGLEAIAEQVLEEKFPEEQQQSSLEIRLFADQLERLRKEFQKTIEAEIRRRMVLDRGAESVASDHRKKLPEDVAFLQASRQELETIGRIIQPMARKIAVRLTKKRKNKSRGSLDFRQTVRHSLSTGGVPAELHFTSKKPGKPEVFILADISGSVSSFARFTLHLVHALSNQFSRVRSYAFIDGIDEVTHHIQSAHRFADALERINTQADVIWKDGHSNYGYVLETFWLKYGKELSPRSTVLILGDARNNYYAANAAVLQDIQRKSRNVFWLNPEPKSYWNTGDSIMGSYETGCDKVFEVRNLRQLENFIDTVF